MILDQVPPRACGVLDIGCGSGELAAKLADKAKTVLAIDSDGETIKKASQIFSDRKNLIFRTGDAEHLDESVRGLTFDCIVSVFTMHHFDARRALEDMKKHLADGGQIIVVDLYADRGGSFVSLLLDQLFLSHLREIGALNRTAKEVGIANVLRFLRWRFEFAASAQGRRHMRRDFLSGTPPPLAQWRRIFEDVLPGGCLRVLMGSVFMYSWERQ